MYTMEIDGRIIEASVERSSGPTREHKQLDRGTLEAVKACRGVPTTVNGTTVRTSGRVEYLWKLDKICMGLDLAPATNASSETEVVLCDVRWERYDYDRSNHVDYFFYWLSDRDGQEFLGCIFDHIKDRIARNEPELSVFFS